MEDSNGILCIIRVFRSLLGDGQWLTVDG
jgi:hypothetical protein